MKSDTKAAVERMRARLIPPADAAEFLGISARTLFDRTKDGTIPSVRIGDRCRRYSVAALEAFIEKQLAANSK